MPRPHATPTAMPAGYYVRAAKAEDQTFRTGPFPSREDAIDEAPAMLRLKKGEAFEVGLMQPFTPRIAADTFLLPIVQSALEGCGEKVASGWVHTLSTLPTEDFEDALNLVLSGWLTRHEAHPAFGLILEVSKHTHT